MLDENGWNTVYLRDKRYDAVIHLVTAADGAEKYYTLENNVARYEDAPTAIRVDQSLQNAWRGHPHHIIIDNSAPSFEQKVQKTINAVEKFVGVPVSATYYRKFLVETCKYLFSQSITISPPRYNIQLHQFNPSYIRKIQPLLPTQPTRYFFRPCDPAPRWNPPYSLNQNLLNILQLTWKNNCKKC